ncbi:MAG: hypothetical protein ACOYL6_00865 [Bacteriovoracaceae bacterium]
MGKQHFSLLFLLLIFCFGCGQSAKEKKDSAILSARISLTLGRCQDAIDTLESLGRDHFNADYLTTLASAYSCRAGFSQIVFFGTDVAKISSSNINGSFSKFTTSPMTDSATPDTDAKFSDLQTAIDILIYAGNLSTPSNAGRSQYFNSRDLGNISTQALYMVVAQIGKLAKYYGNPDSTGLKGMGSGINTCYYTYADPQAVAAIAWINANTSNDTCNALSPAGHPDFDTGVETIANVKKRMCRGVVLFNNFVDLALGTTLSAGSEFTSLKSVQVEIEDYIVSCAISTSGTPLGTLCNERSQSSCEATATLQNLEIYYAAIFEPLHI